MAFEANLMLSQRVYSGLGHSKIHGWTKVALKRPFEVKSNGQNIRHLSLVDEGRLVVVEANMLAWAHSLLNFSYRFIDHRLETIGRPSFPIPRLRFVEGAIVFPQRDIDSKTVAPISNRAVYLLEEIIHKEELPFLKYIHNSSAAPLQDPGEEGYDTGVFLCFIQHLQYVKTSM